MGLKHRRRIEELEALVVDLQAELAGEKAKGVLLQKRAERAEATKPQPVKPDPGVVPRGRRGRKVDG